MCNPAGPENSTGLGLCPNLSHCCAPCSITKEKGTTTYSRLNLMLRGEGGRMLGKFLRKQHMEVMDLEQRFDARDELAAQSVWLVAEMEKVCADTEMNPAVKRGLGHDIQQLHEELIQSYTELKHNWPESWKGEKIPPDLKERLRQMREKREIRARAEAAWARAFATRTGGAVPTNHDIQTRPDV